MSDTQSMDDLLGTRTDFHDPEKILEPGLTELPKPLEGKELREAAEKVDLGTVDHVDEVVLEAMRLSREKEARNARSEMAALFGGLSPEEKRAVLATYHEADGTNLSAKDPMYIDQETVPAELHLHWISPRTTARMGMRGYTKVRRTRETQKWAPNARTLGTSPYIVHGTNVLCAKPNAVWVDEQSREWQLGNEAVQKSDQRFQSAMRAVRSKLGLSAREAEELDRQGTGLEITRDRDSAETDPERIDADEVAAALKEPSHGPVGSA